MTAQVEGWKNVVNSMRNLGDLDDGGKVTFFAVTHLARGLVRMTWWVKPATDINDPRLEVGLRFNSKEDFTYLIRHQGVQLGKKLRLKKNDKIRCVAYCKELLRTLRDIHKCGGASYNHGCANAKYFSRLFKDDMRVFPGMTVAQFVEKVHWELKITISVGKAKRAMARARRLIEGSTVVLATRHLSDGTDKFNEIYIAYEACKTSFKQHCRSIIGLDGCHLKGQGKGILLTAIGLDPNDQIFPVAYGVVAIENIDTWSWFLNLLVKDLDIKDSSKWRFISDRQKGLINVVRSCCHNAEHCFCVWHMHNNFKKVFSSPTLKDKIWEATRATNVYAFDKVMKEVKGLNTAAHTWLTAHTAKESWSRAFFGFEANCDILVNNISECYNRVLLFAREKPLYGMLECICMYLMDKFTSRRKMAAKLEDCVGPKIRRKLEKIKEKIGDCMVREAGEWVYQVNTKFNEQFVDDI
ncbi:uncharacterized protein LOC121766757 [Salvia splendens]|uniref:uncharacterized protein LOC121766757 n=1 Tax=Salvia splendens TaxID=180675 RepID=UPI001C2678A1|nr:uncharacterized protein LOC121766757 [Salvia splendens]